MVRMLSHKYCSYVVQQSFCQYNNNLAITVCSMKQYSIYNNENYACLIKDSQRIRDYKKALKEMDCLHIQYSPGVRSIFLLCDKFGTVRSVGKLLCCSTKLQFDFHTCGLLLDIQTVATLSGQYTCIVLGQKSVRLLQSHLRKSRHCKFRFLLEQISMPHFINHFVMFRTNGIACMVMCFVCTTP